MQKGKKGNSHSPGIYFMDKNVIYMKGGQVNKLLQYKQLINDNSNETRIKITMQKE